ncbi:MAG: putative porin [Candidatus Omnitrophica bacterium]|nr:putative porin [Candidatus Omnitrophota bacterium]
MRKWTALAAAFLVACFLSPSQLFASEVDVLLDKLVEKGLLTRADAEEVRGEMKAESRAAISSTEDVAVVKTAGPEWKVSGDIRLRNEYRERTGSTSQNRQRVRFRVGVDAKISDELKVGARVATGSLTDPVSTNQTFDDTFVKKNFNLDRAYIKWTPDTESSVKVMAEGGIFGNPFHTVSPMIWDDDLSFAGVAGKLTHEGEIGDVFLVLGVFPVDSDGYGSDAPTLYSTQLGASVKPFENARSEFAGNLKVTGAFAFHIFQNTANKAIINTQTGNTAAASDFNEFNPSIQLDTKIAAVPFKLFADYVNNDGGGSQDTGYLVGFKLGKAKEPWSLKKGVEVGYFYEKLEADAAFDAFVDSDFGSGGTNHKGHKVWLKLATLENSSLQFAYFDTKAVTGAVADNDTFQVDWVTKF